MNPDNQADRGRTVLVMNALAVPLLAPRLPGWIDLKPFATTVELMELAPLAEIGWFDLRNPAAMRDAIERATRLRWLNSIYAGVDFFPLETLAARGALEMQA